MSYVDPRIAPPKPHRDFRQSQRRSQRRYMPKTSGQPNHIRYIPPPDLRQPVISQSGVAVRSRSPHSRRSDERSASFRREEDRNISYSHESYRSQVIVILKFGKCNAGIPMVVIFR